MTLVVFMLAETAAEVTLTVIESGFSRIPLERRAEAFTMNEGGWAAADDAHREVPCASGIGRQVLRRRP